MSVQITQILFFLCTNTIIVCSDPTATLPKHKTHIYRVSKDIKHNIKRTVVVQTVQSPRGGSGFFMTETFSLPMRSETDTNHNSYDGDGGAEWFRHCTREW